MKAIHVQKHYMLGYMCKPQTLKMEEYMAWVEELNNYIKTFPGYHDDMELLQNDELLDLYKWGVPTLWQK
jgi:antibiotic biosynthesis monooxygenase (ABM) superfamily enzyme